jgi:hypothetical protein
MVPRFLFVILVAAASGMSVTESAQAQCSNCGNDVTASNTSLHRPFKSWHSFRSMAFRSKSEARDRTLAPATGTVVASAQYTLTRVPLTTWSLPPAPAPEELPAPTAATEIPSAENVVVSHQVSVRSPITRDPQISPDATAKEFYEIALQLRRDAADLAKTTGDLVTSDRVR